MRSSALRAAAWMTLAQALFSVMATGARLTGSAVPWQEVCASRFIVGAITAFAVARVRGVSLRITRRRESWIRSLLGTAAAAGTFYVFAARGIGIGDAGTLFATAPIFVALFAWPLLAERPRATIALPTLLAFSGIVLIAGPSFQTSAHLVVIGTLVAVTSALAMIWLRKIGPSESSEAIVFRFACIGTVIMLIASIPVWRTPDARSAATLALTGLSGGLGQIAMTRGYALEQAARVSAIGYVGVVFTRALALPIFGEVPNLVQLAGSALVIGSGLGLALQKDRGVR